MRLLVHILINVKTLLLLHPTKWVPTLIGVDLHGGHPGGAGVPLGWHP